LHVRLHIGLGYQLDVADLLQPITSAYSTEAMMAKLSQYDELLPGFTGPNDE